MDARKSLGLLGVTGSALVLAAFSTLTGACAAPVPEASGGISSKVTQRAFDANSVLDDKSMRDSTALSAADVQTFLEKTPWGTKSVLATYSENGKSAAEIMVASAQTYRINPLEMLVRVQMEQGLVNKTTATDKAISFAFGCGCSDGAACSDKYSGFTSQADCAAGTMSRSMDKALTSTGTVSGWARNKAKATLDGVTILPKTAATAALYTYTPWVGEAGGGRTGVGGVSLHAQVWDRFAQSANYGAWATQSAGTADADAGAPATPDPTDDAGTPDPTTPDPTTPDPTTPDPTDDAGTPDPTTPDPTPSTPDASTTADAGAKGEGTSGAKPPADGSDDGNIIGEGSSPPSSNSAPPLTKTNIGSKPEELPLASDADLAGKSKGSTGCSTTGSQGSANGWLVAAAVALVASRRRRTPR